MQGIAVIEDHTLLARAQGMLEDTPGSKRFGHTVTIHVAASWPNPSATSCARAGRRMTLLSSEQMQVTRRSGDVIEPLQV